VPWLPVCLARQRRPTSSSPPGWLKLLPVPLPWGWAATWQPVPARGRQSALTIALSYIAGGMIPLSPYLLMSTLQSALLVSVGLTLVALFLFGFFKGQFTAVSPWRSGAQTVLVGGLAAGVAFLLARLIG
jgi:predicted membrane protein (TIGR00267 family)